MNNFIKNLEQIPNKTPQETFDKLLESNKEINPILKIVALIGWNIIAQNIINQQKQVSYFYNGFILCGFCISNLLSNNDTKITEANLELGTECIKSLNDILVNQNPNFNDIEKENRKRWFKIFLDIWKEYTKKALTKEKRLLF